MHTIFQPAVYIMANRKNGTLYTGVTSHLMQRILQHREGTFEGHSKEHGTNMLVWFELHGTMETAILREKRVKKWNRQWRINLIEADNPDWRDLALDFGFERLPFMPVSTSRSGDGPPPSRG
jgi:putative endonuclease